MAKIFVVRDDQALSKECLSLSGPKNQNADGLKLPKNRETLPVPVKRYEKEKLEIASQKLELPLDRLGDLVILSGRDVVLGKTPVHHDLSALKVGLRSHGGRYEEMVPFVFSHPLSENYARRALGDPRNFHIFDYTINGLNR